MADTVIAVAGVNAFKCVCDKGTVFIPVNMHMIARMRCGESITITGKCHAYGHIQEYNLTVRPPFPALLERT